MYVILKNQELNLKNVLTFRGEVTQEEAQGIVMEMLSIALSYNVKKESEVVITNYNVYEEKDVIKSDCEIMIAMDRIFPVDEKFFFKKEFILRNAIKLHYEGSVFELNYYQNEFKEYIYKNNIEVITNQYMITTNGKEEGQINLQMYMGVKSEKEEENIL